MDGSTNKYGDWYESTDNGERHMLRRVFDIIYFSCLRVARDHVEVAVLQIRCPFNQKQSLDEAFAGVFTWRMGHLQSLTTYVTLLPSNYNRYLQYTLIVV